MCEVVNLIEQYGILSQRNLKLNIECTRDKSSIIKGVSDYGTLR